jgi:hypothetical protein
LVEPSRAPNPLHILQSGNIDLWNRPVIVTKLADANFCATSKPYVYEKYLPLYDETVYIVIESIWCDTGVPVTLSFEDAKTKYDTTDVHHGIFTHLDSAKKYIPILIRMQKDIVAERFPVSYKDIWNGTAQQVNRCS